jgi:lipoprotein-releasing system ATP-binding protein
MLNENQEIESEHVESVIAVRNMRKSFSNGGISIDVLNELNFDLFSGETVAIVGASGIGKSTLLHIVGTLDRPDSGKLLFKGEDVFSYDDLKLARFRNESVGFVFQFTRKSLAAQAAEEVLVRVGLKDRLNYRVGKLSGGEQQRVALARALVLKPLVLLADEPTGNLDKANSERIHSLLMELNREFSMTLVVVTHNMDLAACMSRSVTIVEGKLAAMP